ncbi:hypothetical protein P3W45_000925 [Vairimorpha bombi]|jgi:hypothetical protein
MDDEFESIENERKLRVNKMLRCLIKERELKNEIIEKEFNELNQKADLYENDYNQNKSDLNIEKISSKVNNVNYKVDNVSYEFDFNIQLTDYYKNTYLKIKKYLQIEKSISEEKEKLQRSEILKLKIEVNKRLNQLNSEYDMIISLSKFLTKYIGSYTFIEIFALKILEQSIVQVSRYQESYKQYALFFKLLYSEDLFIFYKLNLLNKKANEEGIRGIYSVYFGILNECDFIDEVWSFGAGMLNMEMESKDFVVLDVYLEILGIYLVRKKGGQAEKLFRYIKKFVVNRIKSPSQKYKIEKMISKLI